MTETRQAAAVHDAEYFRKQRVPASSPALTGEPVQQIKASKIAHFVGPHRPRVAPPPATPIRVTRADIERALVGANNINPHTEEIIDRIVLEMSRMDGFAEGSPPFLEYHDNALRLLREIGLYPLQAS